MSRLKRLEAWLKSHWQVVAGVVIAAVVLLWLMVHRSGSSGASSISIPGSTGGGSDGGSGGGAGGGGGGGGTSDAGSPPVCPPGSHAQLQINQGSAGPAIGWACVPDPTPPTANPTAPAPSSTPGFKDFAATVHGVVNSVATNLFSRALTSGPENAALTIPNGASVKVVGPNVYGNGGLQYTPVEYNGQTYYVIADELSQALNSATGALRAAIGAGTGPAQPKPAPPPSSPTTAPPRIGVGFGALGTGRPTIGAGGAPGAGSTVPGPMTLQQLLQRGRTL